LQPCIKSKTVKLMLSAIQNEQTLSVLYHSNDDKRRRTLSPHHLVYVNHRYHVRAYCHLDRAFLDFTLARMKTIKPSATLWKPATNDDEWHHYCPLYFYPKSIGVLYFKSDGAKALEASNAFVGTN